MEIYTNSITNSLSIGSIVAFKSSSHESESIKELLELTDNSTLLSEKARNLLKYLLTKEENDRLSSIFSIKEFSIPLSFLTFNCEEFKEWWNTFFKDYLKPKEERKVYKKVLQAFKDNFTIIYQEINNNYNNSPDLIDILKRDYSGKILFSCSIPSKLTSYRVAPNSLG